MTDVYRDRWAMPRTIPTPGSASSSSLVTQLDGAPVDLQGTSVPPGGETAGSLAAAVTASRYNRWLKPTLDRVSAAVLILLLLPVYAVAVVVVLVTLGRPILYRQRRVGQHGEVFEMLKFRTMQPDRRQQRKPVPSDSDRRRRHKSDDDPRHTQVGRFLRRTSWDELPQLWNVLRGDMSIIGPRPELEDVVAGYAAWQHQRHLVKPGITGLWQVTDRQTSAGDMHLHTETDLMYLQRLSLRTDFSILVRTPLALTKGR